MIDIESGGVISGKLPKRALALVAEWHAEHKAALRENWARARRHRALKKIAPLE